MLTGLCMYDRKKLKKSMWDPQPFDEALHFALRASFRVRPEASAVNPKHIRGTRCLLLQLYFNPLVYGLIPAHSNFINQHHELTSLRQG